MAELQAPSSRPSQGCVASADGACVRRLSHDHSFSSIETQRAERRTLAVIGVSAATMLLEVAAGLAYGSLALLADGLHMASHVVALAISAWAYAYARRHARDSAFSFGTGKVSALAGFTSALLLGGISLFMAWESVARVLRPEPVAFDQALLVAGLGLAVNAASAWLLGDPSSSHTHDQHSDSSAHQPHADHNLRSARLHVLADAFTSVLAIAALASGKYLGWSLVDPLVGLLGAAIVLRWALSLIGDCAGVLLDHNASEQVCRVLRESIEASGQDRVADLHVWRIAPEGYAAVITIVSSSPRPPDAYRSALPPGLGLRHVNVEVHACEH